MCAIISINKWFFMPISQTRGLRPNSSAVSLPTPINSAAGGLGQIVSKLLILLYSWVLEGRFSGVTTRFLPHSRDMRWGPRRTGSRCGLLRGDAAVDDETGPGHKAGVVRGEKDDALGDVGHRSHAADRQPGQRLPAHLLDGVGIEIARPHDEHLIAHLGLGCAGVDRVGRCQVDYTSRSLALRYHRSVRRTAWVPTATKYVPSDYMAYTNCQRQRVRDYSPAR